ncbi:MAG: hypothetical protein ACRC7G_01255, partial [Beijerinckiaceae bacterium]
MSFSSVPSPTRRLFLAGAATLSASIPANARVQRVPSELANEALELPGRIVLGNRRGDATLIEFFDYN